MSKFVALSSSQHRGKGWLRVADSLFAERVSVAPLVGEELPHVLATMPMGFLQREDGSFELVAVMSLEPQRNLFVHPDGRWVGGYKPAFFRSYPFRLLREEGSDRHVLCFDEDSGLILDNPDSSGEQFFGAEGELAPLIKQLFDFLTQWERQRKMTQRAVDALAGQGLIVPWEIKVAAEDKRGPQAVEGLFRVDEKALSALDEKGMAALRAANALPVAYAQSFSQHRMAVLSRLHRLHSAFQWEGSAEVESLFGGEGDDLSFDFDS